MFAPQGYVVADSDSRANARCGEGCSRTSQKFSRIVRFIHLMGVHLIGVHLMGVHLIGVHLMGAHLIDVYLMDVY